MKKPNPENNMISADTNIIARALLDDDPKQTKIANNFLKRHTQGGNLYLSPFMLLELAWLLKSKGYERKDIVIIFEKLIYADGVTVGQKDIIVSALDLYSKHNISFADCLISSDSIITANAKTATFDKALQKADQNCISP